MSLSIVYIVVAIVNALIVWFGCLAIGGNITRGKGRGFGEGAILGGLLGIVGVFISVCLSPLEDDGFAVTCPTCHADNVVGENTLTFKCSNCATKIEVLAEEV